MTDQADQLVSHQHERASRLQCCHRGRHTMFYFELNRFIFIISVHFIRRKRYESNNYSRTFWLESILRKSLCFVELGIALTAVVSA